MREKQIDKSAEWVFDDADELGYTYKCSCCGRMILIPHKHAPKPSECIRCGAKMKGAGNEKKNC
jgi:DNA-directed RNA polymerase subunit RPC12/RpoP